MQKALRGIAAIVLAVVVLGVVVMVWSVEARTGSPAAPSLVLPRPTPDPHP